jgi:RNA polymerase sigma-70 factor (ECF subfamily)
MELAQDGDRDAFRTLLDEITPAITNFVRKRIGDPNEIDDACQETLLAIYQSRHTYTPGRPLEPWLFAIARYACARHLRRCWSRSSSHLLVAQMPERAASGSESLGLSVRQALKGLSRFQLEAFMITKVQGFSLLEASERTGASVGALKVRVHRAYELLKESLL